MKIMGFILCLSWTNPNYSDGGICEKLQHKLEVDLLNIVQLKLAQKRERSSSSVNPPPLLFHIWARKHNLNILL